jgi:phage shock protein PspC (stress-responsive transcriptional regulator)
MDCNDAVAALVAMLENGTPMTDEQRAHIRTCERCREVLAAAKELHLPDEAAVPEVDDALLHEEVHRRHHRAMYWKLAALPLGILAVFGVGSLRRGEGLGIGAAELLVISGMLMIAVLVPGLIVFAIVRSAAKRRGAPLYRRLDSRRWWLGVCTGLEEALGIDRNILRVAFFVLTFGQGIGLWIYLVLALATPVHPGDREYLWRFQARRWLEWIRSR